MINKRLLKADPVAMRHVMLNVLYQWIGLILNVIIVAGFILILNFAINQKMELFYYFVGVIIIGVLLILRYLITINIAKESYRATENIKYNMRKKIFYKLSELDGKYQDYISTGKLALITSEGVDQLEVYFSRYLPQFFFSMLAAITLFVIVSQINLIVAIVLFVCVPLIPISIVIVQKIAKKLLAKYWNSYTGLGDNFLDNIQGLTTLKVFQVDSDKQKEMNVDAEKFRKTTMKVLIMQLNSISVMDLVAYGGTALGAGFVIYQLTMGNINLYQSIFIILISAEFFLPMRLLGSYFHIAMNGISASKNIFDFLDTPAPKLFNYQNLNLNGKIVFDNMNFSYFERESTLVDISIELPKGLTAIVGASGSGKSTLANLITGKLDEYSGSIKLNDYEQSTIHPTCLKENITFVESENYIFKGTFRENLLIANPNADNDRLNEVLKTVQLDSYIIENQGLNSEILENGANLSGGQKQRLAIARALLRDTPIYIFDEATSNIDSQSEQIIIDTIYQLAMTKIVILISHRLVNVERAKRIYTLEKGIVSESGTFKQLLKNKKAFYNLYSQQKKLESIANVEEKNAN